MKPKPAVAAPLATDEEKIAYSLGLSIYRSLARFNLTAAEIENSQRGMRAAPATHHVKLDNGVPSSVACARVRRPLRCRAARLLQAYLGKVAAEPGAVRTPSS